MTYCLIYDPANGDILDYRKICSTPEQEATVLAATPSSVKVDIEPMPSWLKNAHVDPATKEIIGLPTEPEEAPAASTVGRPTATAIRTPLAKLAS